MANHSVRHRPILGALVCTLLGACSTANLMPGGQVDVIPRASYQAELSPNTIHTYAQAMTQQLVQSMGELQPSATIAVGTFLPPDTLSHQVGSAEHLVALQMQESLYTTLTQLGFELVDFRLRQGIGIEAGQDAMLTRSLDKLASNQQIDYFLTGTISTQQDAYIVNARLVDNRQNTIIAAATELLPVNLMWSTDKVQRRQGALYRSEY